MRSYDLHPLLEKRKPTWLSLWSTQKSYSNSSEKWWHLDHNGKKCRLQQNWAGSGYFFSSFLKNWSIVNLQFCVTFMYTAKWLREVYLYIYISISVSIYIYIYELYFRHFSIIRCYIILSMVSLGTFWRSSQENFLAYSRTVKMAWCDFCLCGRELMIRTIGVDWILVLSFLHFISFFFQVEVRTPIISLSLIFCNLNMIYLKFRVFFCFGKCFSYFIF